MKKYTKIMLIVAIYLFINIHYSNADDEETTDYTTNYQVNSDLSIYFKVVVTDHYKIVLYKKPYLEDDMGYFNLDVYYNGTFRRVKYYVVNSLGIVNIFGAETTNSFCNKFYVVIRMKNYYEINATRAKNDYVDIFVNMEDNDDSVTYLNYDRLKSRPSFPLNLVTIRNSINYKCVNNKLTFEY